MNLNRCGILLRGRLAFGHNVVLGIQHAEMNRLCSFAGEGDAEGGSTWRQGKVESIRAVDVMQTFRADDSEGHIGAWDGPGIRAGIHGQLIKPGS